MSYDGEEDLVREYEMIYTLFHPDDEEEDKSAPQDAKGDSAPQDGAVVRILKFLFGPHNQDGCGHYSAKTPYHKHVEEPSEFVEEAQSLGVTERIPEETQRWTEEMMHRKTALMTRPRLEMPGPGEFARGAPRQRFLPDTFLRFLYLLAVSTVVMMASSAYAVVETFKNILFHR